MVVGRARISILSVLVITLVIDMSYCWHWTVLIWTGRWKEEGRERWKEAQIQCQVEWWGTSIFLSSVIAHKNLMDKFSFPFFLLDYRQCTEYLLFAGYCGGYGSIQDEESSPRWSNEGLSTLKLSSLSILFNFS